MGVRFFFVRGFEGFFEVLVALVAFLGVLALVVFEALVALVALVAFMDVLALVVFEALVALVVFETLAILTFLVVSEPSGEPDLDVLLLINLFLGSTWVRLK